MQIDRCIVACLAAKLDQALTFAEAVDADEVRATGIPLDRGKEAGDLAFGLLVMEDGERECRLGDEHVAGDELERETRRVGASLVVAGDDGSLSLPFEH